MSAAKMRFVGVLPAGNYYVGDPSYPFDDGHETWLDVLKAYEQASKDDDAATFHYRESKCFISSTNSGDGTYYDQNSNVYGVDRGLIGAIPVRLAPDSRDGVADCHIVHFDKEFRVGADLGRSPDGKRIQIGDLIIKT